MRKNWIKTIIFTIAFLGLYLKTAPQVEAQTLDHFDFTFNSGVNKTAGQPFQVTITAKDSGDAVVTTFTNTASLTDATGTISPNSTGNFVAGIWDGYIYITQASSNTQITATYSTTASTSTGFVVEADSRIKFISVQSGNNQVGIVGAVLPTALQTIVSDPYNNPLNGVGVNFAISSYPPSATNQSLSTYSGSTDASGLMATTLTLGRKTGNYAVSASLGSGINNSVLFFANATTGTLNTVSISPSVAIIPLGSFMAFTAVGYDQYQNPVLITPTWSVVNGGGAIDQAGIFRANTASGIFLNTVRAVSNSKGSTASVTVVGSGSGIGATATVSASPTPTPGPTQLPAGVLNDVFVDPSVITALKDAEIAISATAVDLYGANITSTVNFTFEATGDLGTITQTSPNTVLLTASEGGVGTITVKAQQGDVVKIAKIVGSVGTGLNRRLIIEPIDTPQRVNEPFTISIAAKDSLNNFVTNYTGPIVIADTTGTIDPEIVQPSEDGIWYVQTIVRASHSEVTITVAGDGMVGVSNIFEVTGEPSADDFWKVGGAGDGGLAEILGSSISAKLKELFLIKDLNKYTIARYIGAGLAGGIGILGASIGGGLMASKGLEAIGRNPYAKRRLKVNLYISIAAFLGAATLAVYAAFLIIR